MLTQSHLIQISDKTGVFLSHALEQTQKQEAFSAWTIQGEIMYPEFDCKEGCFFHTL